MIWESELSGLESSLVQSGVCHLLCVWFSSCVIGPGCYHMGYYEDYMKECVQEG